MQDAAEAVIDECEFEASGSMRSSRWCGSRRGPFPPSASSAPCAASATRCRKRKAALHGDISGVTLGLGVTFNATLTALSLCILVMFCLHQLQQAQDRLVLDTRTYIDRGLIRHMRVFK